MSIESACETADSSINTTTEANGIDKNFKIGNEKFMLGLEILPQTIRIQVIVMVEQRLAALKIRSGFSDFLYE